MNAIEAYIAERNPQGAIRVLDALRRSIEIIAAQPQSGYVTNRKNLRVKLVADYPYKVFYRVSLDGIEIVHVRHAARRNWAVMR